MKRAKILVMVSLLLHLFVQHFRQLFPLIG
jgi:hypothetical protein